MHIDIIYWELAIDQLIYHISEIIWAKSQISEQNALWISNGPLIHTEFFLVAMNILPESLNPQLPEVIMPSTTSNTPIKPWNSVYIRFIIDPMSHAKIQYSIRILNYVKVLVSEEM